MRALPILCIALLLTACAASPNRLCFTQKNDWEYLDKAPSGAATLLAQLRNAQFPLPDPKTHHQLWFHAPQALYLCVQQWTMPRANDACGANDYRFNLIDGSYQFDGRVSVTSC
jgi:hypothetical protein